MNSPPTRRVLQRTLISKSTGVSRNGFVQRKSMARMISIFITNSSNPTISSREILVIARFYQPFPLWQCIQRWSKNYLSTRVRANVGCMAWTLSGRASKLKLSWMIWSLSMPKTILISTSPRKKNSGHSYSRKLGLSCTSTTIAWVVSSQKNACMIWQEHP